MHAALLQEAVYEAITKGWEPIACKPLVEITYQVMCSAVHGQAEEAEG
jgi:hypothetical protein